MENGKDWSHAVTTELGNYDYLMFADIDYSQEEVKNDVKRWFEWIAKEAKIQAVRFDAVKHYSADFLRELLQHLDQTVGTGWFLVGEVIYAMRRLISLARLTTLIVLDGRTRDIDKLS